MKNRAVNAAASLLLGAALGGSGAAVAQAQEPIAFIGHGVMFDAAGKPIQATPVFIERAQGFYIESLSSKLPPARKAAFDAERARYLDIDRRRGGDAANPQDALIINAALIDWLIKEVPSPGAADLQGKNNLIKARLRQRLYPPEMGAPYAAPEELLNLLRAPSSNARGN